MKPWYQKTIVAIAIIFSGMLALGALLDAISNATALITPTVTYIGTLVAPVLLLIAKIFIRKKPLTWVTPDGKAITVKRLGLKSTLYMAGMIILLWVPRFFPTEESKLAIRVDRLEQELSKGVLNGSADQRQASELASNIPENATAYGRALKLIAQRNFRKARILLDQIPPGPSSEARAKIFRARAQLEFYAHEYLTAAQWYNRALIQTPNDPALLSEAANAFFVAGDRGQAELLLERAFALAKDREDTDPYLNAALYSNLGVLRNEQGRLAEAQNLLEESIKMQGGLKKPSLQKLIETYTALGINFWYQEKYSKAESMFLKVADLERHTEGKVSVASLLNLGLVYSDQGNLPRAESYLNQALKVAKGPQQRHAALENLAAVRFETGRLDEAELMFREALKLAEEEYGPNSGDASVALYNLGDTLRIKGDTTQATETLERAIEIGRNRLGDNHPEVGKMLYSLAREYELTGKPNVEALYLRSITILETKEGQQTSFLIMPLARLSHVYISIGKKSKAVALTAKILAVKVRRIGPESKEVADNLYEHAHLLRSVERYKEAAKVEEQARTLRRLPYP